MKPSSPTHNVAFAQIEFCNNCLRPSSLHFHSEDETLHLFKPVNIVLIPSQVEAERRVCCSNLRTYSVFKMLWRDCPAGLAGAAAPGT